MTGEPVRRDRRAALASTGLLLVAVVLVAANLRPAVSSLGAILDNVRVSLHAGEVWASTLTALPGLCFGLAGFASPLLARWLGMARAVGLSVGLLVTGLAVRVFDGPVVVAVGTFVACAGIAVSNVLIPVVVKESYPHRLGLVTGIYTASLQLFAALGSALTPQLERGFGGWRPALGSWAVLGLLALVLWSVGARHGRRVPRRREGVARSAVEEPAPSQRTVRDLLRNRLAWMVTLFFGLQSLFAYIMMGWMPQVFVDAGVDRGTAGVLMALVSVLGVPASLVITPMAARRPSQSGWASGMTVIGIAGVLGLLLAPGFAPLLWAILIGIGMGVFAVAIALISLRTRHAGDTRQLSTMTQGIGYLLAAVGPLVFGVLQGVTGNWTASLLLLLVALGVQAVVGVFAGRPQYV